VSLNFDFHSTFMIWQWFLCANAMSDGSEGRCGAVKAGITAAGANEANYRQQLCI
jgi:hypothetical protein